MTPLYVLLWTAGFTSDAYTTHLFWKADPGRFSEHEGCSYMRAFCRWFGFKGGLLAFLFLVEVPLASLISFALIPASLKAFSIITACSDSCSRFASALAFLGAAHLSAAFENFCNEEYQAYIHRRFF